MVARTKEPGWLDHVTDIYYMATRWVSPSVSPSPVHGEIGGARHRIDGEEDWDQDEEGITPDRAQEILEKLAHFREIGNKCAISLNYFFSVQLLKC